MDFKQAVIHCLRDNYANFNGRAARPEFWWFVLACFLVSFVLGLFNLNFLSLVFNLAVLVPSLAVGARRLHDIGKSGWFQLLGLTGIGILLLIYWFVQPSVGPNAYGEGPAAPADAAALPPGVV